MAVYLDTGALIALYEPRDTNHGSAKRRLDQLRTDREVLVSGWHTIVEFIDGLAHHYTQARAAQELDRLRSSPRLRIEDTEPYRQAAIEILDSRTDWGIDLSDALSFATMEALELQAAFAYDEDFEMAGFEVLR